MLLIGNVSLESNKKDFVFMDTANSTLESSLRYSLGELVVVSCFN